MEPSANMLQCTSPTDIFGIVLVAHTMVFPCLAAAGYTSMYTPSIPQYIVFKQ